jgi:anti-sigma regulatory factor (Ser/Thr protein kinase)
VIGLLRQWDREDLIDDAGLVCAELTTNAVLHAGSEFTVAVSRRGSAVRIAVRDASRRGPVMQHPEPTAVSGRGLILVTRLAKRWGIDVLGAGKVVWADLA